MKEPTQTELVFSALKELGAGSYTTRDIMSAMTNNELDRLKHDSKTVSKLLQKLEKSGRIKQAEKVRMGSITVSKWKVINNTDKPVVSAAPEIVESETVEEIVEETVKETVEVCQTEAEFSFTAVKADTINSLIDEASCTAQMAVKSIMLSLQDKVDEISIKESGKTNVDPLIDGLMEVSDLLSEKIAVKNVIPVIEFLRGLK